MPNDIAALECVQTEAGLEATVSASERGLALKLGFIAFGDGNGTGYTPLPGQTELRRERARISIGGGERVGPQTIALQGLLDAAPEFWCREMGFYTDSGVLFAVWSHPTAPRFYKSDGVPIAAAYTLKLSAVPAGAVSWTASGPNVAIVFENEFTQVAIVNAGNQLRWMRQYELNLANHLSRYA